MIRKMTQADISSIVALDKRLFHSPWNEEQFQYEMSENVFASLYVIEENEQIVGYIDYWITFESAQLAKIAIAKEAQQQGHASALMKFMIEKCNSAMCENISLEVRKCNAQAIALYTHYEFMQVAVRKGYYQDGEDALLMVKALGGNYV